jgi:hypothetical protein
MTENQASIREVLDRHIGLITTAFIFVFVVTEVLVASRMNVATATAIISSAGAIDVALGVLTASYSPVILILLFTVDAWRAITDWRPLPVYLEAGLILTTLVFVPLDGALVSIAILVVFNLGDVWFERRRGIRPEPWRAGGTAAITFFVAVFLFAAPVWVPAEAIAIEGREPINGYVVGIDADWTTILVEDDRSIMMIRSDGITERLVCTTDEDPPDKSVMQLVIGSSDPIQCTEALADVAA